VKDRFRLIYLKSPESEKPGPEDSFSSRIHEESLNTDFPSSIAEFPERLSSQAVLNQVKEDLKNGDSKSKKMAIQYLEKVGPSVAISLLQEALLDRDPEIRVQAFISLTQFEDPSVYPLLKKYLRDRDPRIRMSALRGLFKHKEKIDLNILLQFLSDESSQVRRKLATLLGWTQMEGILPILTEMSKDRDPKVRKAALFSLVSLYPEESEDRLIDAMTDPEVDLRRWAKDILEKSLVKPLKGETPPLSARG
jgi:HEAT repeat protein